MLMTVYVMDWWICLVSTKAGHVIAGLNFISLSVALDVVSSSCVGYVYIVSHKKTYHNFHNFDSFSVGLSVLEALAKMQYTK